MAPAITGALAASIYTLAAVWQWRRLRQNRSIAWPQLASLGLCALVLHGVCTYLLVRTPQGLDLSLGSVSVLILWVVTAFTLLASIRLPVVNLLLLVFPLSALVLALTLLSRMDGTSTASPIELSTPLATHILLSLSAYSLLAMAAGQSLLLRAQERRLKNRQVTGFARLLPPMETMERLLFTMLMVGFAFLTIAIASGFAFLDNMFAQNISHHTILACLGWLAFAVLLIGHKFFGWRGTTAVRWTLGGFVLLVLAYSGSKFVTEVLLAV